MGRELHVPEDAGSNVFQGCVIVLNSPLYVNMALLKFGCRAYTFLKSTRGYRSLYLFISFSHHSTRCFSYCISAFSRVLSLWDWLISFPRNSPRWLALVLYPCFPCLSCHLAANWLDFLLFFLGLLRRPPAVICSASGVPREFTFLDWKPHHVEDLASLIVLSRV